MATTRVPLATQASSSGYRPTITRHADTDVKLTWASAGAFCIAGFALPPPTEGLQTHSEVQFAEIGQAKPYMLPQMQFILPPGEAIPCPSRLCWPIEPINR